MSEFERFRMMGAGMDEARDVDEVTDDLFPDDFSSDEAAFASELRDLFSVEREELPPLFVETLAPDPTRAPATPGFEQKMTYTVFRRLSLPQRPLFAEVRREHRLTQLAGMVRRSRPVAAAMTFTVMLMILSVVLTSPSFAAGLRVLLGHTGIEQVRQYPTTVKVPVSTAVTSRHDSAPDPQMPLYWLGPSVGDYNYLGVRQLAREEWSKGSITDIQYTLGGHSKGTGLLDIREFQIADAYSEVLQVVQAGSARERSVTAPGAADTTGATGGAATIPAVYVNGGWITMHNGDHLWQSDVRSELIFEHNGVIFWVVGDQRDGMGADQIVAAMSHIVPSDERMHHLWTLNVRVISEELTTSFRSPVGTEVCEVVLKGSSPEIGLGRFVEVNALGSPSDHLGH